jgi:hypothetical protein
MAIGINDLDDDYEDLNDLTATQDTPEEEPSEEQPAEETLTEESSTDREILEEFLKSRGIEDISRIKFDDDSGEYENSWDDLSTSEKLTIMEQLSSPGSDLDNQEIDLLNAIRTSKMTPQEYLAYVAQSGANQLAAQMNQPNYQIDQYNDDELFVTDLISRTGRENITQEEALEALDKAKSNPQLFAKQVAAIRNEYKQIEDQSKQQQMYLEQQQRQEEYNQFAYAVMDQVNSLTEMGGFDINMSNDEREELYDFITGFDQAGNSILGKALNDPRTLVRMAWFALNGDQMLDDMSEYIKKQVAQSRQPATKSKRDNKVFVNRSNKNNQISIEDLD